MAIKEGDIVRLRHSTKVVEQLRGKKAEVLAEFLGNFHVRIIETNEIIWVERDEVTEIASNNSHCECGAGFTANKDFHYTWCPVYWRFW